MNTTLQTCPALEWVSLHWSTEQHLASGSVLQRIAENNWGDKKTKPKAHKDLIQMFVRDHQKLHDERSACIWFNSKV